MRQRTKCIMGIDLGSNTGISVINEDGTVAMADLFKFPLSKNPATRFIKAQDEFAEQIQFWRPAFIGYEAVYRWASSQAAFLYNGFLAQLLIEAYKANIPIVGYSPSEIKKFATGKGRASKEQMIAEANSRFGLFLKDDNIADSLLVASLTKSRNG